MTATEKGADMLTLAEVAVECRRSETTVKRWLASGRLKGRRILGRVYIARKDVEQLLKGEAARPHTKR